MIKVDEHELIEFFEELPLRQNDEEKEFFGTTIFKIIKEGIVFTFSIFEHFRDIYIDMHLEDNLVPFVELHFNEVQELSIRKDRPIDPPVLLIKAKDEDNQKSSPGTVEIRMKSHLSVKISNSD
jgi:hypothetical protein